MDFLDFIIFLLLSSKKNNLTTDTDPVLIL